MNRLLNYDVLNPLELLLAGEGKTFRQIVLVGPQHLFPRLIPQLVSGGDAGVLLQLIHDPVHDGLQRRFQITVLFFPGGVPQTLRQVQHEALDVWAHQCPGAHLVNELPQRVLAFLGKRVPLLCLALIDLRQVLMEDFLCQPRLDFCDALLVQETGLAVGAVADHMDVGVVALIMEGGVPAELTQRYLHRLRDLRRVAGEQVLPAGGAVIAQAGGVLPAQRDNGKPDIAGVIGHRLRHLGKYERVVRSGEQSMRPTTLGPWTLGDVVHIVLPLGEGIRVVLNGPGDELGGVSASGGGEVVFILEQPAAEREIPEELADHLLLPFGSGQGGFARVEAVHALTGGDVADIVPTVGNGAMLVRLEVGTLEDDPRHSVSPPCGQHRNGPERSGVQSVSSR